MVCGLVPSGAIRTAAVPLLFGPRYTIPWYEKRYEKVVPSAEKGSAESCVDSGAGSDAIVSVADALADRSPPSLLSVPEALASSCTGPLASVPIVQLNVTLALPGTVAVAGVGPETTETAPAPVGMGADGATALAVASPVL